MKNPLRACGSAVALALLGLTSLLTAQTIPNASFEANSFGTFPGYVSGNGPITDWTGNPPGSYGLNPAGSSPFANNGVVPDGLNVAFIQSTAGFTTLENTITGLTPGNNYRLQFRTTARGGQAPLLRTTVDGASGFTSVVNSVGATAPYRWVSVPFTSSGATASLQLVNEAGGDNTVVVDDFRILSGHGGWMSAEWTDDSTAMLPAGHVYTHAYNFGSSVSPVVSQVGFTGVPGTAPAVAGRFSVTGTNAQFNGDPNSITGFGSRALGTDFIYNGQPATLTLNGLTAGREYVLTLYSAGWEAPGVRWITFRHNGDSMTLDQAGFGNNNGIVFSYPYTADAGGNAVFEMGPVSGNSFHLYGFANRESAPLINTAATFNTPPVSISAFTGTDAFLSVGVTGSSPMTYQWLLNGTPLSGETNATLLVPVDNIADAGFYSLRVTNSGGTTTSPPIFLEVYESVPGLVFDTGLDEFGGLQQDGLTDANYTLHLNPDNVGVTDAFVQNSTATPIVAGPWLANSGLSKWIGPRFDTVAAAGPDPTLYQYRTTVDLTGRPPAFIITGGWAVDNVGNAIFVNGVPVPNLTPANGFGALTPFRIDSALLPPGTVTAGINTIDFQVLNQGVGYTGLRIEGTTFAAIPAGIAPVVLQQPVGRSVVTGETVTLSVRAYGTPNLSYTWLKNGAAFGAPDSPVLTLSNYTNAQDGNYTVRVTNGVNNTVSNVANLTAVDVPAFIVTPPASGRYGVGDTVTLSATASGSLPLSYQWTFNGADLPGETNPTLTLTGVTRAQDGNYRLRASNTFGAPAVSDPADVSVQDVVPGVFNTGVDDTGAPLQDSDVDLHYTLLNNPDGEPMAAPTVQNTGAFPITAGPWIPSSATSKWIGPRYDTAGAAAGDYTYRTVVDLSAFNPDTIFFSGQWATDNNGVDIVINGTSTGLTNTLNFTGLTSFVLPSGAWTQGINTIDFIVNNGAVGYTGLHVQNLRLLGDPAPLVIKPVLIPALNSSGQFTLSFTAEPGYSYVVEFSESLLTNEWVNPRTITTPPAGGAVIWTETQTLRPRGFYRVKATLPPT